MYVNEANKFVEPGLRPLKSEPFSLDSLIAWLEKQPANGSYVWECTDGSCLIGQYATHIGYGHMNYADFCDDELSPRSLEWTFVRVALGILPDCEHTFGAALKRARSLKAQS